MSLNLATKNIVVTGGSGFLGSFVIKKLKDRGCKNIFIPRSNDCDLVQMSAVKKLYKDIKPDIVVHLAAKVGGIGANRANPGKFFYDNLMMGAQLMEESRLNKIEKFVALGTICCYPKFTPVPFKEENLWNGYPEETNAPYGLAKKMLLVQSQAYRQQYDFNSIFLMPVNLYGPCFSKDTQMMTKEGVKFVKDVKKGEIVYTLNPNTFEVEQASVTATQQVSAHEFFVFKTKSIDFKVTPDHKIFYKTSTGFVKRRADFFRSRVGKKYGQITFAIHKANKTGLSPKFIDFSKYVDKEHIKFKNGYVKDFGSSKGNSSGLFPLKYKIEDFAEFLGWYISEGSIAQTGINSHQIRITQCSNKDYRHEIEQILISMNIPFGKDDRAFYFTSRIWKKFIEENIGKGAANKKVPDFVFDWHPKLVRLLFNALMKGDGHRDKRKYTTKSDQLMFDFLHLAFLCGIKVGAVSKDKGCWKISMRLKKLNTTIKYKDMQIEKIKQKAYCITTDKNHIIYAGRNLKFNWIGQCDNFNPDSSHVIPALIKKCLDAQKHNGVAERSSAPRGLSPRPKEVPSVVEGKGTVPELVVWGTGKATREFLYVEDCAEAIVLATEKYNKSEPINIGAGFEISIKDLADLISKLTGFKGKITWDSSKPDGQPRRMLDTTKAFTEFGFKAQTNFEQGLKNTIDWYKRSEDSYGVAAGLPVGGVAE